MKKYTPPKRVLFVWYLRSAVLLGILSLLTLWVWFFTVYFSIVIGIAIVIAVLFNFAYLPVFLKSYSITVDKNAVIIRRGVFIKRESVMPQPRLVYAEHITTPTARLFSVSAIAFRAARAVTLTVELEKEEVREILEVIAE